MEVGPNRAQRLSTLCRVIENLAIVREEAEQLKCLRSPPSSERRIDQASEFDSQLTLDTREVHRRLRNVSHVIDRILASGLIKSAADMALMCRMRANLQWGALKLSEFGRDSVTPQTGDDPGRTPDNLGSENEMEHQLQKLTRRVQQLEEEWNLARNVLSTIKSTTTVSAMYQSM